MKCIVELFVASAVIAMFCGQALAQSAKPDIESLAWLSGCWEQRDDVKKRFSWEQWMRPAAQTMIGMSRTVRNGKTVAYEFMRITQDDSGISFIAKPSENSEETTFRLASSGNGEAVFENLAHDYPQRIIYRLNKKKLLARVEGTNDGKLTGIDLSLVRAKCR